MGLELKVEQMSEHDIEQVIAIGTTTSEFNTGTNAQQFYGTQTLKRWVKDPNGVTLVAKIGDNFTGFALGYYMTGPNDGYINCIVVDPGYRKKGIGKILLQQVLSGFKSKSERCNHIFCVVESDNTRALNFFRSQGLEIGREFRYLEKMIYSLKPSVLYPYLKVWVGFGQTETRSNFFKTKLKLECSGTCSR